MVKAGGGEWGAGVAVERGWSDLIVHVYQCEICGAALSLSNTH